MTREAIITRTFVELADSLVADFDVTDLLTMVAERCVEMLDVDAAGLMLTDANGRLRVVASSSEAMRLLELFELESREGPCVDAFNTSAPVVNLDLKTAGSRWPDFAPAAVAAGFHSADALPLRLRGTVVGALNLFRTTVGAMNESDLTVAQAFADVATIAILQQRAASTAGALNDQLQHALDSRVVIEQAKGMIAERRKLTMEEAFLSLRAYARNHNLLLGDVARNVISGVVPFAALDEH